MDDAVVVSLLTPVDDARPLGILIKVEEEIVTELVGHDFFLYLDQDSKRPSVVYRRKKGYNYGVIHLDLDHE